MRAMAGPRGLGVPEEPAAKGRGRSMTVRVLCPSPTCGAAFAVDEGELGQPGCCPRCGTGFVLVDGARAETIAYEARESSRPALPARLGRYEVVRKLGEGGMGTVYLARDTQLDRPVALKVPHASGRDGAEALERFDREAKTAACFQHPNFCPIYDVGQVAGWHYLAMAYIEGQTLAAMIARDGAMPPRRAAAITRKLALALQEAHDRGVVHRDLKPSNVMVNRRRELILMDFGLARREGTDDPELTRSGLLLGSPHYMAPEQVRADRDAIGPATDIYALGVMLYEMLTGRRPFVGATALVLGLIATSRPDPPSTHRPDLDPELEATCLKAMAREPADRYPSMRALVAALEAYLARQQPAASSPAPPGRLPPVEEIQLAPEPELAGDSAPAAFVEDESGSAYHLVSQPDAAPAESPEDEAWAETLAELPRPSRTPAREPSRLAGPPRTVAAREHGRGLRSLADLMYVVLCVGGLVGVVALLVYWTSTGRGTIQLQLTGPPGVVRIDGQVIPPEDLERPIELRTGDHELLVTRGDRIVATERFQVNPGPNSPLRVRPGTRPRGAR